MKNNFTVWGIHNFICYIIENIPNRREIHLNWMLLRADYAALNIIVDNLKNFLRLDSGSIHF